MIVVIDGPSGSGKSTTAREVASRTGFYFLDSGAFYRCFTLAYIKDEGDLARFPEKLPAISVDARFEEGEFRIRLDGTDVTREIRDREVTANVSRVAELPPVRARVNELLREVAGRYDVVADGRDLGTAVFPHADLKFFMVADLDARVGRRLKQLAQMGLEGNADEIRRNIEERDRIDSARDADPLRRAADAVLIDTSGMEFEEQVELIIGKIRESQRERA